MHPALQSLLERQGRYRGEGTDHEGDAFEGSLELRPVLEGRAAAFSSRAIGRDGIVQHAEESVIAEGRDGTLRLHVVSTNQPDGVALAFLAETVEDGRRTPTFRVGEPAMRDTFRDAVSFDLWDDGDLTHRYARGLPGGDYAERSGARMQRVD